MYESCMPRARRLEGQRFVRLDRIRQTPHRVGILPRIKDEHFSKSGLLRCRSLYHTVYDTYSPRGIDRCPVSQEASCMKVTKS